MARVPTICPPFIAGSERACRKSVAKFDLNLASKQARIRARHRSPRMRSSLKRPAPRPP